MNCNYKVKITDIQTKYKFKVFCTGYDDSEIKEKIDAMYQAWPKATAEGETPTLDNTANATMSIDLKGNTSQETTTGKNLIPNDFRQGNTTSTTATNRIFTTNGAYLKANQSYIISTNLNVSNFYWAIRVASTQFPATADVFTGDWNTSGTQTYTPTQNCYLGVIIGKRDLNASISVSDIGNTYVQVEEGNTATDYEEYTGGVASPNPDYPQDVHVVTGDNTIKVEGKNIANPSNIYNGYPYATNGQTITYYSSDKSITYKKCCYIEANQQYTLSWKRNTPKLDGIRDIKIADENEVQLFNYQYSSANGVRTVTFTSTASGWAYVSLDANATEVQIEKGSEATDYAPYQSKSYPVNLGSMELCKIGDYQDYIYKDNKKWYKYETIGKVVLDGTENISGEATSISGHYRYFININDIKPTSSATEIPSIYCDHYKGQVMGSAGSWGANQGIAIENSTTRQRICINDNTYYTQDETAYKSWLSTNNVIVYYPLNTPTATEITDTTLISQLEALKQAESYSGQTNISQTNDDKPFIITAKALKDLSNL